MVQKMLTERGMGRVKRISFSIFKVCNEKSTSFSLLKYIKLLKKKSRIMRPYRDLNFLNSHTDAGVRKEEEVRQHLYSHSFNSLQIASYQITFAFPSKQRIYSYTKQCIYLFGYFEPNKEKMAILYYSSNMVDYLNLNTVISIYFCFKVFHKRVLIH